MISEDLPTGTSDLQREPIAIVGIGCHFPGGAFSPEDYWRLLCDGVDATGQLPPDRWEVRKFYDPDPAKLGKMVTFRGGFLDRIDQFDAGFFGISPREAIRLDPQQRLLLRTTWEAFEDAGLDIESQAGRDVGVFIGGFTLDYKLLQNYGVHSRYDLQVHSATGMMMTMLANRLSHAFDLRGPSITVDTACSASLVALHLAAQAIWNGECAQAVAGGVNLMIVPNLTIAESKGGFLSPDGRCKTFDSSANGYARGEGAGVVLLKPLADALANHDPIYALVRGTAVTQDGHTDGITVPNGSAQEAAMRLAYARAGVSPHEIQYVEAHGTGTPVGDPIEATAIGRVLSTNRPASSPILVGSVKTNIGHLEAAAGMAGLIKTALSLKHGRIPGHLHLNAPNPAIPFDEFNLRVPRELTEWPTDRGPRYAGVNSFGFGGTNAHALLQEAPTRPEPEPQNDNGRRHVITLSARSPEALRDTAERMCDFLDTSQHSLADTTYACNVRRSLHDHRLAVVGRDTGEARERLRNYLDDDAAAGVITGRSRSKDQPKLAFVFSGMGPQFWGMARELLDTEPAFRAPVEEFDAELRTYTGWSLLNEFNAPETESRMGETEVAQPANFAVQVGLAALWKSWGIVPDAIVGHSAGEVAAQYVAGVLSLADATRVVYYRSSLQQRSTGTGRMLAVGMSPENLAVTLADAGPEVSVAAINSPSAVTLSGDSKALEDMAAQMDMFGVFHKFLPVSVPYHSHYMDPLRTELEEGLAPLRPQTSKLPLYSTVTGSRMDGSEADAEYWWRNVRGTVLFSATVREMIDDGYTHFLEVSAHPVLASSMRELLTGAGDEGLIVPSLRRDDSDEDVLLRSLGTLHSHGHTVHWDRFHPSDVKFVKLPSYPWQLDSYWTEPDEAREDRHYHQVHPLLGQRMNAPHATWELEVDTGQVYYLADHRIQDNTLMPGAAFVEMMLAAGEQVFGERAFSIENLQLRKALVLTPMSDARLRTILYQEQARVEIASYLALPSGERQWTVHATAELRLEGSPALTRDLTAARDACANPMSWDQFYERTRGMGFQYGPAFQGIREISTGDGVAVGEVMIPDAIAGEIDNYLFHPCLVDAAFQVLLVAATQLVAEHEHPTPYLPVGVDRIRVLAPAVEDMTVIAHVVTADRSQIISNIVLCDPDGRALVEIDGFRAQSLAAAASVSPERIDRGLYELQWIEAPDRNDAPPSEATTDRVDDGAAANEAAEKPKAWVVFADEAGVGAAVASTVRAFGRKVFLVAHADAADTHDDGADSRTIDPTNPDHYLQLAATLNDHDISTVVHLWSLDAQFDESVDADDLEASQGVGVLSVMHLMQALSANLAQAPKLWLVTRGAQQVGDGPAALNLAQTPMWGLGRVIGHQEFATLWGGLCDLDPHASIDTQASDLVEEITADDVEDQVAFRNHKRYVARLVESTRLTPAFPAHMRAAACYLVTGGLGSLGLLVARFLVERGARDVVLMGRTPVPDRATWDQLTDDDPRRALVDSLRELETYGARIHLAAVDIADADQLRNWLHDHQVRGLPAIRGVIHTAGVVNDELLLRMDQEKFTKVLRPKLNGGWQLHQLFEQTDLDFFVLFSSTGSVIASPGQANYAAGNAFLDALAHYRRGRGLPGLSIGWGPWAVGMVQQLDLEQMYSRRGIELITPQAGMQILGRVLQQRVAHVVAITVDWSTARETSLTGHLPPMFDQAAARSDGENNEGDADSASLLVELREADDADRVDVLAAFLRGVVARALGLDVESVCADETLNSMGLDSMMAIETKYRVEVALQIEVSVLDLLHGATIDSLSRGLLSRLGLGGSAATEDPGATAPGEPADTVGDPDELEQLLAQTSPDELADILRELEVDNLTADDHGLSAALED